MIPIAGHLRAWTIGDEGPVEALGVASPDSRIVGTVAAGYADPYGSPIGTDIVARDLMTGRELWRWAAPSGGVMLVAEQPNMFHVMTTEHELITIDAMSGATRSRFSLVMDGEEGKWLAGHVYASNGFVAVERLAVGDPIAADDDYYFSDLPMLLAAA
jgi:hypothetical protein